MRASGGAFYILNTSEPAQQAALKAIVLRGPDPLHLLGSGEQVRCYTYGGDLARGIVLAMTHPAALNVDIDGEGRTVGLF